MNDYFHQRATREQLAYVDHLVQNGIKQQINPQTYDNTLFSGILGETVVKDTFGLMRSSYRTADKGVDLVVNGMKVDIKTSGFNPTVKFFDGIVLLKKEWLDHYDDKVTDVLLFVGHEKDSHTIHFFGWLTISELRAGIGTGEVRVVRKGEMILETKRTALTDSLVIPRPSLHRFANPDDFRTQMLELATAPAKTWEFKDEPKPEPQEQETPKAPKRPTEEIAPTLDKTTISTFEGRINELETVFTVVCRSAITASKIRSWLKAERVEVQREDEKRDRGAAQTFKTCFYCGSGYFRYAVGRKSWRDVCENEECREKYARDKKEQKNRPI